MVTRSFATVVFVACLLAACSSDEPGREPRGVSPTPTHAEEPGSPTPSQTAEEEGPRSLALDEQLQAELTIEGQRDWMAAGYGSVWVLVDEASAVARIDPATNELAATIEVGGHPCDGVAAGFGAVWVPSCTERQLYRISSHTDEVEATIDVAVFQSVAGAGPFGGLAAGEGAVWIVTEGRTGELDALARIDPRSNAITDTIPLGHLGGGVAVGEGAVWVTAPEDGVLVRVDPVSLEIVDEVEGLAQPAWVATGEGAVWVLSGTWRDHPEGDGSVTRVDPTTNEIVARIRLDDAPGQAGHITVGGGSVWARTQFTLLARIDPASNTVVERYSDVRGLGDVDVGFGSVWLSDSGFNKVWRLPLEPA